MWQGLLSGAAAGVDRMASQAATALVRRGGAARLEHPQRLEALAALAQRHQGLTLDALFGQGPAPVSAAPAGDGSQELRWPSAPVPLHADVADWLARRRANREGVARLYSSGRGQAPALIVLHGFMCGHWRLEKRLWPLDAFMRWGLDVAVMVLPMHAVRADGMAAVPRFPNADPRKTVEGLRQAVADVRTLAAYLRARGAPQVGLMGMSLGAYTAALTACVEPFDALVPMIPLACMADFARDTGALDLDPGRAGAQHRALREAYRVVSPLHWPSRMAPNACLVVQGRQDRVTPPRHAQRLAEHLSAPLHDMRGGHVMQWGRSHAFRAAKALLRQAGMVTPGPDGDGSHA